MVELPNETQQEPRPQRLSERIENHRKEVQYLIKQGGEHPQYEFKRAVSLSRDNLDDRLDFVKLMQAVANAEIATERCIVIGADPKETMLSQTQMFSIPAQVDDFEMYQYPRSAIAYLWTHERVRWPQGTRKEFLYAPGRVPKSS